MSMAQLATINNGIPQKIAWNFVQSDLGLTEIFIYDSIADKQSYNWWTDEKGTEVTPMLFKEELNKVTTSNICVRINSGGGDVFAAEAIRTAIMEKRQEGKKVTCKIDGFCGSAAVGICAACEHSAISSSAYFMIHDPEFYTYGYYNISDLGKCVEMLSTIKQGIINAYAKKIGKDKKEISDLMTRETWYTGDEAVEAGFCDELMFEEVGTQIGNASKAIVNSVSLDLTRFPNMPISLLNRLAGYTPNDFTNITTNAQKESVKKMEIKTVDELKTAYPKFSAKIAEDATNAERKRIQDIEDVALNGYETIVNAAKYENPIAAGDVAKAIVAEQKKQGSNYLDSRKTDADSSGVNKTGNSGQEAVADGEINQFDAAIDKLYPAMK